MFPTALVSGTRQNLNFSGMNPSRRKWEAESQYQLDMIVFKQIVPIRSSEGPAGHGGSHL